MRWVLFWVFVSFFVLIVIGTLIAVFLGWGKLEGNERTALFTAFLVEIGAAVVALFYSVFGLKPQAKSQSRVRLGLAKVADVPQLVGKTAMLSLSRADGTTFGDDVPRKIFNDRGPYIPLEVPPETHSVYVTVKLGAETYEGSFVVGTHLVDLTKSEGVI